MLDPSRAAARSGLHLLRAGLALLLLAMLVGVLVPIFAVPQRAVSAHVLGVAQGLFLVALGLVWPRLELSRGLARAGSGLAVYGCFAAWIANLLAAAWRAGGSTLPMVEARGTAIQELAIAVGLRSAAVALIAAVIVVLWGLRRRSANPTRALE